VVGAVDFVAESLTSTGQWQLTCYSVNTDYSNIVQTVTLEQDADRPTFLQAVGGEGCVCGIVSKQVTIWYHSSVCETCHVLPHYYLLPSY